ncbi:hypothetical protein [Anaerorhabdus sp.]|uniref:hypothetical protein n=1 Tax=Anaerorhabdus sp. TaxID=1872524 RepID=UPI002FCA3AB7
MEKMKQYWWHKQKWVAFIYFTLLFTAAGIDRTGLLESIIYLFGLYRFCENYQVFFDSNSEYDVETSGLVHLLPILKKDYCKAQIIHSLLFVSLSTLLCFGTMSFSQNIFEGKMIFFVLSWLWMSVNYFVISYLETTKSKGRMNFAGYRSFIHGINFVFISIMLVVTISSSQINQLNQIGVIGIFCLFSCLIGFQVYEIFIVRNKNQFDVSFDRYHKITKNKYKNIMQLASLSYTKIEKINIFVIFYFVFASINYVYSDLNVLNIANYFYFLHFILIALTLYILEKMYSHANFVKLVPVSKKDIFHACIYRIISMFMLTSLSIFVVFIGMSYLIKGQTFIFSITSFQFWFIVTMNLLSLCLCLYGMASKYFGFFYFIAGFIIIILSLAVSSFNIQNIGFEATIMFIIVNMLILISLNMFFKGGYKRLSMK